MYCHGILDETCWSIVWEACASDESEERQEAALHVFAALADAARLEYPIPALSSLLRHSVRAARSARSKRLLNTALDCLGEFLFFIFKASLIKSFTHKLFKTKRVKGVT